MRGIDWECKGKGRGWWDGIMKRQGKGDIMCSSTRLKAREGVEAGGAHAERRAGVTRAAQKRTVRGHGPGTPAQARMRPARHRHCAHQLISSSSGRAAPRPGPRSSTPLSRSPLSRCATPRLVVVAPLCLPSQDCVRQSGANSAAFQLYLLGAMASSAMLQHAAVASAAGTGVARSRSLAAPSSSQRLTLTPSHLEIAKIFCAPAPIAARSSVRLAATHVVALKDPSSQDSLKRAVAKKAIELVKSGMVVGLGTGSTSSMAIEELGSLIKANKLKDIVGVATSYQSKVLARQFGVKTVDLNDVNHIDIAFDGADEVDAGMNLIKGGGAAHTMEKVVDSIAKECVILIDETKVVKTLGLSFPLPVEVLPFALAPVLRALTALGGQPEIRTALRKDGPVITDLGNMVVDVRFPEGVIDPADLENKINMIPGVIENGLFINVASKVLVGTKDGEETSVVEFADFVASMKSSGGVSA